MREQRDAKSTAGTVGTTTTEDRPFSFLRATALILPIMVVSWYVTGLFGPGSLPLDRQIVSSMLGSIIVYKAVTVPAVQAFLYGKRIHEM